MAAFSRELVSQRMVLAGLAQVLVGVATGFVPASAVAEYRLLAMAHGALAANGALQAVLGLAVPRMALGWGGLAAMELLALLGCWGNGLAPLQYAFIGLDAPQQQPATNAAAAAAASKQGGAAAGGGGGAPDDRRPLWLLRGVGRGVMVGCGVAVAGSLLLAVVGLGKGFALPSVSRA